MCWRALGCSARLRRAGYRRTLFRSGAAPAPDPPASGRRFAGGLGPRDSSAPVSSPVDRTGTATSSAPRRCRSRDRAETRLFSSAALPYAAAPSNRTSLKVKNAASVMLCYLRLTCELLFNKFAETDCNFADSIVTLTNSTLGNNDKSIKLPIISVTRPSTRGYPNLETAIERACKPHTCMSAR